MNGAVECHGDRSVDLVTSIILVNYYLLLALFDHNAYNNQFFLSLGEVINDPSILSYYMKLDLLFENNFVS